MSEHHSHAIPSDNGRAQRKRILVVAAVLSIVTIIEFIIAFTIDAGTFRTALFLGLTVIKAFYIVADFMHLKHEVKVLIWSILIPMIFVVWLVIALINEGSAILQVR
ncbi:cytochrome C oxidase subunit IV family protein [Roseivirga sp. BDSF3-8]|uniref:cytochrome C oxidase subunit IV family protein n=1 Tax=Roseivirga sp. BDSF3-8 TaxID=3241598 RepID=UPI003531D568